MRLGKWEQAWHQLESCEMLSCYRCSEMTIHFHNEKSLYWLSNNLISTSFVSLLLNKLWLVDITLSILIKGKHWIKVYNQEEKRSVSLYCSSKNIKLQTWAVFETVHLLHWGLLNVFLQLLTILWQFSYTTMLSEKNCPQHEAYYLSLSSWIYSGKLRWDFNYHYC